MHLYLQVSLANMYANNTVLGWGRVVVSVWSKFESGTKSKE